METSALAEQAKQNGHGDSPEDGASNGARRLSGGALGSLIGRAASTLAGGLADRLTADLDDRDPDYIRENLPLVWLLSTIWFRGEVRNLGNIPEQGPVLLVGNHSGGN